MNATDKRVANAARTSKARAARRRAADMRLATELRSRGWTVTPPAADPVGPWCPEHGRGCCSDG